jgi:NAD-dependent dihydropyrimidine dehydrogenase PreA subunit
MTYVIAEPCIGTKDTACVDACPVDCIDCGACVPVCPVSAIFALDDLPEKWASFTERNAKYYGR